MSLAGRVLSAFRRDGLSGVLHGLSWRSQRLLGGGGLLRALGGGLRLLIRGGPRAFASRVRWGLASGGPVAETPSHPFTTSHAFSFAFNELFDLGHEAIIANRAVTNRFDKRGGDVRSVTWFLTYFDHALFGGVHTILRLMDFMALRGVSHRIVIFDRPSATDLEIRTAIAAAFPSLSDIDIVISSSGGIDYDELPPTDIAVATMWISAYPLARFNKTSAKFYMVQDFEPVFYSAGTLSALCEATYRMGFAGIVNTPGLSEVYHAYGNPSVSFMPAFTELERPSSDPRRTAQVVLYGRPSTDRNAFELIASACHLIKARHGEDVRIVSAGEDWIPEELGLGGIVDNRGRLNSLSDVQDLYRNSDVGICFQLSKHPSYQPFEYLAAGVAPVVNVNRATEWFLADGENCLAVEPFPSEIARVVSDLIEDPELRSRLVANGRKQMREVSWESELSTVWDFICGHE